MDQWLLPSLLNLKEFISVMDFVEEVIDMLEF